MRDALCNSTYRKLFFSQVASLLGTGLVTVTLALLAFEIAAENAGLVLGSILAIKMIAYVGFAPVANALVERVDVRPLLIALDVMRILLVCLFPFIDAVWQIYVLVLFFQMCSATYTPAYQSTIPEVLRDENTYAEALSLSRLAYNLESMASPLIAGLLLALVLPNDLFFVSGLAFALAAFFVFKARLPKRSEAPATAPFAERLIKGFRIFARTPRLRGLFTVNLALSFSVSWILVNSIVYAQNWLDAGNQGYALLMAAFGSGSIVGALLVPRLLKVLEARTIMIGGALSLGILPVLVLAPPSYPIAMALWCCFGLASSCVLTPGGLIITRSAASKNRSALFAAQFSLSHSGWLLTYPLAGWLGSTLPLPVAFIIMAMASLILTCAALRLWPAEDPAERTHTHVELEHEHPYVDDDHHRDLRPGPGSPDRWTHKHGKLTHTHVFYIDDHHPTWAM